MGGRLPEMGNGCLGKKAAGAGSNPLMEKSNAKETAHEGTYNMQRESLMLSRLRLY